MVLYQIIPISLHIVFNMQLTINITINHSYCIFIFRGNPQRKKKLSKKIISDFKVLTKLALF